MIIFKDISLQKLQYNSWLFGLLSCIIAALSIFTIVFFDYTYAYLLVLFIYILYFSLEWFFKIYSWTTICLLINYIVLNITPLFGISFFSFYIGTSIYLSLFIVCLIGFITKKYITLCYDANKNSLYHRGLNIMWLTIYGSAFFGSLYFIPNITYIIFPMFLVIIGCFISIYINVFSLYPFIKIKKTNFLYLQSTEIHFSTCDKNNQEHLGLIEQFINNKFLDGSSIKNNITNIEGYMIFYAYKVQLNIIEIIATSVITIGNTFHIKDHCD